jgi:hypothetical protein
MSCIEDITNLELLPNEILIQCFQYLKPCDLFHSFDEVNHRFNHLIRHIPLCIDFENVNKSMFDEFCTKISVDREIKAQVYSLHLPNADKCFQTKAFWSLFSFEEFVNLYTFERNSSLVNYQRDLKKITRGRLSVEIEIAQVLFSKLKKNYRYQSSAILCQILTKLHQLLT